MSCTAGKLIISGISKLFDLMREEGAVLSVGRWDIRQTNARGAPGSRLFIFEKSLQSGLTWEKVLVIILATEEGDLVLKCAVVEVRGL